MPVYVHAWSLNCVRLFAIPWTVACQVPLSLGLSKQEWSELPFPSPGEANNPGIKPKSLVSPALAGLLFTIVLPGKPLEVRGGRQMQKC